MSRDTPTEYTQVTVTEARKLARVLRTIPGINPTVIESILTVADRVAKSTLPGAYHYVSINELTRIRVGKDGE